MSYSSREEGSSLVFETRIDSFESLSKLVLWRGKCWRGKTKNQNEEKKMTYNNWQRPQTMRKADDTPICLRWCVFIVFAVASVMFHSKINSGFSTK